jgi:uncharacterized iron-regulated membrane protein
MKSQLSVVRGVQCVGNPANLPPGKQLRLNPGPPVDIILFIPASTFPSLPPLSMFLKPKRIIFWLHLITGIVCGLIVALMATTGAIYAFQGEIQAYARRDVARIVPTESARVSLDDLMKSIRKDNPDAQPSGIVVYADPAAATQVMMGRERPSLYANPYTGEVKPDSATKLSGFFSFTLQLHRWLALGGEGKKIGGFITGACSAAFLFLSLSGLYLWWPRHWSWRTLKPATWFIKGAKGKARDWNWHNVFGFWSLPLLIVLSSTGMIMSYRWASNLLYVVAGETPPPARAEAPGEARPSAAAPAAGAPSGEKSPAPAGATGEAPRAESRIAPPEPGARPLGYDALLALVQKEAQDWASISFRMQAAGGARGGMNREGGAPRVEGERREGGASGEGRRSRGATPVSVIVRREGLPLTSNLTLTLNPYTGEVIKREGFAEKSLGNKLRSSVRPVHTGEAFGIPGQLLMFLASVAALILVYTGFALSWRRFFPGKKTRHHQHRGDGHEPPVFNTAHTPTAEN